LRKHLIWVVALAAAVAAVSVGGIATAENTQTIKGTVTPSKLPKTGAGKGVALNVITTTNDTDGDVDGATRAQVFFDDELSFFTRGIPQCEKSDIDQQGSTTAQAKAACGRSQVGAGSATVGIGGNPDAQAQAVVTAFNGKPQGGKPVILLHSFVQSLGQTTVLVGVLKNTSGDFGKVLDVTIQPLPFGTAITRFQTRVKKSYRFRGKRRNYVSGRCGDRNRKLNFKGTFTFDAGYKKTATSSQNCTIAR
jgi:hypothetical protein